MENIRARGIVPLLRSYINEYKTQITFIINFVVTSQLHIAQTYESHQTKGVSCNSQMNAAAPTFQK